MTNLAKDGLFSAVVLAVVAVIGLGGPLVAQQQLHPSVVYDRLIAVVPMIGAFSRFGATMNRRTVHWILVAAFTLLGVLPSALAQERVDSRNTYEHLICLVPMVGTGTYQDPRRPMYAPAGGNSILPVAPSDGTTTGAVDGTATDGTTPDATAPDPTVPDNTMTDGTTLDASLAGTGSVDSTQFPRVRKGILAYSYLLSDDEQFALVEFVAADRSAFQEIIQDKTITIFEKGKSNRSDVEDEFRKYKADANIDSLEVRVP